MPSLTLGAKRETAPAPRVESGAPAGSPAGGPEPKREDEWQGAGPNPLLSREALLAQLEKAAAKNARPQGSTTSSIAALMSLAKDGPAAADRTPVYVPDGDLGQLAREVRRALDAGIEAGANTQWRSGKAKKALEAAAGRLAQETAKRLAPLAEAKQTITRDQVRAAVADAVAEVLKSDPSAFRKENLIGFALFATGLAISTASNLLLVQPLSGASTQVKLAAQSLISTVMGYALSMFNPYFNDKAFAKSRALNYKILNGLVSLLRDTPPDREKEQPIEARIEAQLGEVFIGHSALDGRLQGVLGLMTQFASFIGESFFKARYILDDESNPKRLDDAADLMAGIFKTARLIFYPLKPEFREIFAKYIFSTLQPTLRKHAGTHAQEMVDLVMSKIRASVPPPSEEMLQKYYLPFVSGAFGLTAERGEEDLLSVVGKLIEARQAEDDARAAGGAKAPRSRRRLPEDEREGFDNPIFSAMMGLPTKPERLPPEPRVFRGLIDRRDLAQDILDAVDEGTEREARSHWRKNKYRDALNDASPAIALEAAKRLAIEADAGRKVDSDLVRGAVTDIVKEVAREVPNAFRLENLVGFGLFGVGLALSLFVNIELMNLIPLESLEAKLAVQNTVGTFLGYVIGLFNPFFNDKVGNQSRAINFKLLKGGMALTGEKNDQKDSAPAVDAHDQELLSQIYIEQQKVDGRIQGVLGGLMGFASFIGESFFKARYMLDDLKNPRRMEDSVDLLAGILITARLNFYALKPEQKELFNQYVYSVLEPTLRKHSKVDGQKLYQMILAKIRASNPPPETMSKYYEPFLTGALGLARTESKDVAASLTELIEKQAAQPEPVKNRVPALASA